MMKDKAARRGQQMSAPYGKNVGSSQGLQALEAFASRCVEVKETLAAVAVVRLGRVVAVARVWDTCDRRPRIKRCSRVLRANLFVRCQGGCVMVRWRFGGGV